MPSERILRQIDRLLDEADAAISKFDWEEVRRCAQAVLALDPANADGVAVLSASNRALGETSPAPSPLEAESLPSEQQPASEQEPASEQQTASDPPPAPYRPPGEVTPLTSLLGQGAQRGIDDIHALDSLGRGVFVGRQYEMDELKGALEDALSGRGRMVMLVGEPGVGKSRTTQELATYAQLRGAQILWGRCYEERGMPPYWPWIQAIRSYVREIDPARLRSELGAGGADIAEIVSEIGERLPDIKPPPTLDPDQARFRLFDSVATFLKTASQNQPLVVALDNLHWADKPSLLLLEFLVQELVGTRLLIIGTYRDAELSRQHPLSQILGELTREQLFQRVLLRGLSQEDVRQFIQLAAGISPPDNLVAAVYQQTEGNPLFVTEVVRLLEQEGLLAQDTGLEFQSWNVRIPEGVREVIGRRLDRLSERCNQALTIAFVIGREFSLEQLAPLLDDMTSDQLLVPVTPIEVDTFGEATMLPRTGFYRLLRKGIVKPLRTQVIGYTPKGVGLENGSTVAADVVILATGWKTDYSFLPVKARANIKFEEDGFYLYRQMVHPNVPNLLFIRAAATFSNILTQNLQARWLGELIKGNHRLPVRETMLQEIEETKNWKRKWMPDGPSRGARLALHMQHYHDYLLKDFGEIPRRKAGIFAPFKELFAPYQPSDYHAVVTGRLNPTTPRG